MPRLSWTPVRVTVAAVSLLLAPAAAQAQSSPANVHVVQDGETLSQIALDAKTNAATIASLNDLADANALSVGQSLKLPTPAVQAASPGTQAGVGTYAVAAGDTLWDIAQRFGTTTDSIVHLNHLDDPGHLALGTVLKLPRGSASGSLVSAATAAPAVSAATAAPAALAATSAPAAPTAAATKAASAAKRNLLAAYTVQPGETLSQIAHQFDVRADAIVQASNLDDPNKLAVGSALKVPVSAREHVVASGETLRDIAANEKVDLGSLVDFNQIEDAALIQVGQVVLLPVAANQVAGNQDATLQVAAVAPAPITPTPTPSPSPIATPTATPKPASSATAARPAPPEATAKPSATPRPAAPVVAPPTGSPTDDLAGLGLKLLGSAYVWGGSTPAGFDCSGLVWYVARQAGKQLSRGMLGQYNSGSHPARDQLQVGDLVFFQNTFRQGLSHNGIYVGNNQFLHAADEAAGVTVSSLNTPYWAGHWFGATHLS